MSSRFINGQTEAQRHFGAPQGCSLHSFSKVGVRQCRVWNHTGLHISLPQFLLWKMGIIMKLASLICCENRVSGVQ